MYVLNFTRLHSCVFEPENKQKVMEAYKFSQVLWAASYLEAMYKHMSILRVRINYNRKVLVFLLFM